MQPAFLNQLLPSISTALAFLLGPAYFPFSNLGGRGLRDEFKTSVKKILGQRAAYFCSNPDCMKLTAGPHSDSGKAVITGHAAHICAASLKGPRFDPSQTSEQRGSIKNAIWLCRECGVLVDLDIEGYPVERLLRWKADHEAMMHEIRQMGYSRSLALLQSAKAEPETAKAILDVVQDRRAFWENFDIERPDHVRRSLDRTRLQLTDLKSRIPSGSPMDVFLNTMTKTIRSFFQRMAKIDLQTLKCNSMDPDWAAFADALRALRKAIGMQLLHLVEVYELGVSDEIRSILPQPEQAPSGPIRIGA